MIKLEKLPCVDAQVGDMVVVARTRPLSKTKNHVILGVVSEETVEKTTPKPKKHPKEKLENNESDKE